MVDDTDARFDALEREVARHRRAIEAMLDVMKELNTKESQLGLPTSHNASVLSIGIDEIRRQLEGDSLV